MKEEDYEKKYKESLERAKEIIRYYKEHNRGDETSIEDLEQIFPELAESEDEKIRKWLITQLELKSDVNNLRDLELMILKSIDWLEKQKSVTCNTIDSNNDEKIRKNCIHFLELQKSHHAGTFEIEECIAWLEKQGQTFTKKDVDDAYLKGIFDTKQGKQDARYKYLEEIIAADDIYQMAMNDAMVNEAKEKAAKVLSKLGIGKLLGFENQGKQKPTSDTRYEVKNGDSLSVNGKPFDYEHATITQKDFACDAEEASYTAEVATGDGSIKTVVSKKMSLPNPQSKEWSDEDEEMTEDLIKGCISAEKAHHFVHTSKEIADWLKSLKDRIGG